MRGLGYVFQVLAKGIGTKAAIAVTATAVTVTSGAVGYGGYQAVTHIQQIRQERQLQAEEPVVHPPKQVSEVDPSLSLPQTQNTAPVQGNNTSDSQDHEIDENTDSQNTNDENPKSNELKNKELNVNQRKERLAAVNAKAVPKKPTAAINPVNQLTLQQLYLNALQQAVSGTQTQQPSGNTNSGGTTTNQEQTPSIVPTVNPTPIPDPAPNPPSWSPINQQAKKITPAVLYGENPSIAGTSYITSETQPLNEKQYTVILYLCGTDLESNGGEGTDSILNMLSSSYDMNKVNVLVCAGGTNDWKNDYMNSGQSDDDDNCNNNEVKFNIYQLNPDAITGTKYTSRAAMPAESDKEALTNRMINSQTVKLLGSYDAIDMGQDQLVAGALNLGSTYYPAENYGIVFWNHGGGINGGVCTGASTDQVKGTAITATELESAFASSSLYESGKRMSFIGYDACLMGSVELAYSLSPYCDYMLGSSEITSGNWAYGDILDCISNQSTTAVESGTAVDNASICKMMVDSYHSQHYGGIEIASMACFDLSEMNAAAEAINTSGAALLDMYEAADDSEKAEWYRIIKQARIHCFATGGSAYSTERVVNSDYVDIKDYYRLLREGFQTAQNQYDSQSEMYQKINTICTSIDQILAQNYILAAAASFNGSSVFNWTDGVQNEYTYPGFWNDARKAELWATSLFMPYYQLADTDDSKNYALMNIMKDYRDFTNQYQEIAKADQTRIKRLAAVINYKDVLETAEENAGTPSLSRYSITQNDMKTQTEKTYDVFQLKFKDAYAAADQKEEYTDPYTDFMDTVNKMTMYVSRYQSVEESGGYYDVVYGKNDLLYCNISNDTESINIVSNALDFIYGYMVKGKTSDDGDAIIRDWAYTAEDYNTEDVLRNLNEVYTEHKSSTWVTFEGKMKSEEAENYTDGYLHFCKGLNADDQEAYVLAGFSNMSESTLQTTSALEDNMVIQFWHYVIQAGELIKVDGEGFNTPTYAVNSDLKVYQQYLMYDHKEYNDYTIGFTSQEGLDADDNQKTQSYILPTGQCREDGDQYTQNSEQIGTEVDIVGQSNPIPSGGGTPAVIRTTEEQIEPATEEQAVEEEQFVEEEKEIEEASADEEQPVPEVTETVTPAEADIQPNIEATPIPQPAAEQTPEVITTTTETPQPTTESEPVSDETTPTPEPTVIEAIPVNETPEIEIEIATQPAA